MAPKKTVKSTRDALFVKVLPEDEAWGIAQNRWNCAVVRAVQRTIPDALFVTADTKKIAFSIPEDGPDGIRYEFDPPPEGLLKAFDAHLPIPEEFLSFTVIAREAKPMGHNKRTARRNQLIENRTRTRRNRTKGVVTRQTNRFLDYQAENPE